MIDTDRNITKIKLFATLREFAGCKELTVPYGPGMTVRDVVERIGRSHPALRDKVVNERGELTGLVQILVGGRNIAWLQRLDTPVGPTEDLAMLTPIGGG